MTREEAIQVLNMVEAHGLADEAKRMAIEALTHDKHTETHGVCSDLISRQAAIDAIESNYRKMGLSHNDGAKLEKILKSLPSAEPTHGEWVNEWKDIDGGRMYGACCSVCHTIGHSGYNYCPNCGAKMKGAV